MKHIAIIGLGGIGFRHLQSCTSLSPLHYQVYGVDISFHAIAQAKSSITNDNVYYATSIYELPEKIDVAVIATQANVRAKILRHLLLEKNIVNLILEKVLFQKIEDYHAVGELIRQRKIRAFVNCPRRLWPGYIKLKKLCTSNEIRAIELKGGAWNLGCNAIHYIDLISFLLNSVSYQLTEFSSLSLQEDCKRPTNFCVTGELQGVFSSYIPFTLSTLTPDHSYKTLVITLKNGKYFKVVETATDMKLSQENAEIGQFKIPFQSELTAQIVNEFSINNTCALSSLADSITLHLPMMQTFFSFIKQFYPTIDRCPIT